MSQHGLCCVECHANGTTQGERAGTIVERDRIIELLNEELTNCYCETPLTHLDARIKETNK